MIFYLLDFFVLRERVFGGFADVTKGLRMPSMAEDVAAEIRRDSARFLGSRKYGFCSSSDAMSSFLLSSPVEIFP